jgi:predicted TIM-barrel fold metal-dependent hydrolase
MAPIEESFHKLKYPGAVDADGHVVEDVRLWDRYLETKYKANGGIRLKTDSSGVEYFELNGKPSKILHGSMLGTFAAMGKIDRDRPPARSSKFGEIVPLGAMNARERVTRLDAEGLDAAFIYPTLSLMYETEMTDGEVVQACTRAYNRWIVDWCSESGGRLIPVAHLSLSDPVAAAQELERAVKAGCKGGWVAQFTLTRKPHAHPDHDVLFAKAQELGVPLGLHPSLEPPWALPGRYDYPLIRDHNFFLNVTAADAIRHGFTSFFQCGTFEKFPELKLVLLEVGAGWISYWLDRMDAVYKSWIGRTLPLKETPSYYFKRNVWISADPDEHSLPAMVQLCGEDKFFWATDFPHPDHTGDYIKELEELADKLPASARQKVLGENVMRVYGCY